MKGISSAVEVFPPETPYGNRARLQFLLKEIVSYRGSDSRPLRILDIGCGTGALITKPLALVLPDCEFVGIDIHEPSIRKAREAGPSNAFFRTDHLEDEASAAYDVVICSEVLEHLSEPEGMVVELRRVLSPGGVALVTIPNGYGPKEAEDFMKRSLVRVFPPLRRFLSSTNYTVASLNPAGHLQFFTMTRFRSMVEARGLRIEKYQGRRFLGGPFSSRLLRTDRLRRWNVRLGRQLPFWAVSSWMFALLPRP